MLLGVSRSSLYYRPKGERAENLALMRGWTLHMDYPFYGSPDESPPRGCHRGPAPDPAVAVMGMEATYRRPRTSVRSTGSFPTCCATSDLPDGPCVVRGHHLYPSDARVFLPCGRDGLGHPARAFLAAVQHDGRLVLHRGPGRRLVRATPEILNTDQGSQFTSEAFADRVLGAGLWIFIERLWRSLKYEAVYLHELRDGVEAGRIRLLQRGAPALVAGRADARRDLPQRRLATDLCPG